MGSITRSFANNIGSSGILTASAVTNATVEDVTSFDNAASPATLVLLSTQTASNSATISFTTGLDSTYDAYEFHFINVAPKTDATNFTFNGSTDSGSNYNVTKTSTYFQTYNLESDAAAAQEYDTGSDLAQSTSFQRIGRELGNGADECGCGVLEIYNPSSTTYVKHFISRFQHYQYNNISVVDTMAGYMNTTSAINAIQFKFDSGNFDGVIKLYGVKKS